jgi:hypothetical protein
LIQSSNRETAALLNQKNDPFDDCLRCQISFGDDYSRRVAVRHGHVRGRGPQLRIPQIVTVDSGDTRKSVIFDRNGRSHCGGITGHVQSELSVMIERNSRQVVPPGGQRTVPQLIEKLSVILNQKLTPQHEANSTAASGRLNAHSL